MGITPNELFDLTDKELLERMGGAQPNSMVAYAIESEFRRRALLAQIEAAKSAQEATEATKSTAKWTKYSAIGIALSAIIMAFGTFNLQSDSSTNDFKKSEFEERLRREAQLVKTCPGDAKYMTGPTAIAIRVFQFDGKLWYEDVDGYRTIASTAETACDALNISK